MPYCRSRLARPRASSGLPLRSPQGASSTIIWSAERIWPVGTNAASAKAARRSASSRTPRLGSGARAARPAAARERDRRIGGDFLGLDRLAADDAAARDGAAPVPGVEQAADFL